MTVKTKEVQRIYLPSGEFSKDPKIKNIWEKIENEFYSHKKKIHEEDSYLGGFGNFNFYRPKNENFGVEFKAFGNAEKVCALENIIVDEYLESIKNDIEKKHQGINTKHFSDGNIHTFLIFGPDSFGGIKEDEKSNLLIAKFQLGDEGSPLFVVTVYSEFGLVILSAFCKKAGLVFES